MSVEICDTDTAALSPLLISHRFLLPASLPHAPLDSLLHSDMATPSTFVHFQTLQERVISHPNTPVFKIPRPDTASNDPEWIDVSFTQFNADIQRVARYWCTTLKSYNLPARSVVGVWLRGFTYADVVTIYALSRAGFVPHMFGFELPNTQIVLTLLASSSGKAIIHDPAKTTHLVQSATDIPCFPSLDYSKLSDADVSHINLPPLPHANDQDYTFIYQTSGSVSGMPKIVPKTNKWLSAIHRKSNPAFAIGYDNDKYKKNNISQDIYVWTESFSHSMEICLFQLILHNASCLVQPTHIDFSPTELKTMIHRTGINRIIQFTSVLRQHLEFARTSSPVLVDLFRKMRQVTYAGMPLGTEIEIWTAEKGIPLTNQYGCTECGQLMSSTLTSPYLELLPNVHAEFIPVQTASLINIDNASEYTTLLELHVLPTSPDLPIPSLRSQTGGWKSGDLFEQASPGKYIFRGRDDDWVKSYWSERLDTKAIENQVFNVCALDLVANCVVVGEGRPWPALFVELKDGVLRDRGVTMQQVKEEIIRRLESFNGLRYLHERVQDSRMIYIVLPPRKLPRTAVKGNIRRRGVEQEFEDEIEAMFASMPINEVYGECVGAADSEFTLPTGTTTANLQTPRTSSIPTSSMLPSKDFTCSASTLSIISESNESSSASSVSTSSHSNSPVTPNSETELSIIARYEEVDSTTGTRVVVAKPHGVDIASTEEKEGIVIV